MPGWPVQVRLWCHASMYFCLELLEDVEACLEEDHSWATKLCLGAMAEVSPGSDIHTILAARYWHQQQQQLEQEPKQDERKAEQRGRLGTGQNGPQNRVEAAWKACAAAHRLRYGDVSDEVLKQLVEHNRVLYAPGLATAGVEAGASWGAPATDQY